ncbi:MAG: ABC transporter ATP-binding protein [Firmicutes bacterium]|nr:ABC transporter ATP-binding protein [Bacillota bacterium]
MENILEIKHINKAYPKSEFALRDISFTVPHGTIMGIVGENGSGKTTTLSIILGLLRQDSGTVNIFDRPYNMDDIDMKAKIGVVFDSNYFPEAFTPRDIAKIFGKIYKRWDNAFFFDLLKKYEIGEKQKVKKLSHGTKMMLSIITALSQRPELLILDEPTGGVDPVRREEVLDLFLDFISDGRKSIVFSSHITSDLEKIADYVTIIHKGKLLDTAEKDVFLYQYGIIRCNEETFGELCRKYSREMLRYVKRDYQYRILVKDQSRFPEGDFVMENPTLDEIIYLFTRGGSL